MVRETEQLDTTIEIVTPENIAFRYAVAGPFRRLPAYVIDLLLRVVVAVGGTVALTMIFGVVGLEGFGFGLALVLWFLLGFFYGGFFEAYWNGQTPGKRLMQIRVLTYDGQPINGLQAVLRNILRMADMLPPLIVQGGFFGFYQVGLVATMSNRRFQRVGDLVCGTMVVFEEKPWLQGVARFVEPEVARMATAIPVAFRPSRTLARALATYVQRRENFSWGRRIEIARHLAEPLRQQFGLPVNTNPDLLLCAAYHHAFIAEHNDAPGSPFAPVPAPWVGPVAAPGSVDPASIQIEARR
jgi:uncharacterized RDD family membrane protein YckC